MPKISIIVPVYNSERHIEHCLASILAQTFTDFEVICIDDCSPDRSGSLIRRLMRHDPRVKLFVHHENLGAGGARNTGIRESRAGYVAFFDSDDDLDSNMLELLYAGTEEGSFDIVICGYRVISPDGRCIWEDLPEDRKILDTSEVDDLLSIGGTSPWNKLIRRSLFLKNGISFPTGVVWEDLATIPRLMLKASSVNLIEEACYNYFDRPGSDSNRASDRHLMDFFRAFDVLKEFLVAEGLYEREKHNFHAMLRKLFTWYAERLKSRLSLSSDARRQYLRFCALMARGYLAFDDELHGLSEEALMADIGGRGGPAAPSAAGEVLGTKEPRFIRWFSFARPAIGTARGPASRLPPPSEHRAR